MAGSPRKRARHGESVSWRDHPELRERVFEPGNLAGARSGAASTRLMEPEARRLAEELVAVAPWCTAPAFAASVQRWAWAEAACRAYRAWFSERGLFKGDDDDEVREGQERWARWEVMAARAAEALALTPMSMSKLLGNLAGVASSVGDDDALEALRREGARILAARGLAAVPDEPEGAA